MRECPVCRLPTVEQRGLDAALALQLHGPRWISRRFPHLTKHQIEAHRDRCLGGDPLLAVARARGWLSDAELEAAEQEAAL